MKKWILSLVMLLTAVAASAVEVEIDGLWYNIVEETGEASVIQYKNNNRYSGDIIIPEYIDNGGNTYRVTNIEEWAFQFCGIDKITIPSSVETMGKGVFADCYNLTTVNILSPIEIIEDQTFGSCEKLESFVIPNSVKVIGSSAFNGCKALLSIELPNNVQTIGAWAFAGCIGLTSVAIPNGVTIIEEGLFSGCTNLSSVSIPVGVQTIGNLAFRECVGLNTVTLPESVTSIGRYSFCECSNLSSIIIPNNVTSIGDCAFEHCAALSSVTIPEGVLSIGSEAFYFCTGLTSIEIPNSVETIGSTAFCHCDGVKTIKIGSGVLNIYNSAFAGNEQLTDVYCYAETIPSASTDVFYGSNIENAVLHVPESLIQDYKSVEPWKNFKSIIGLNKCATPSIIYSNGKLIFECETEGVECVATIESADVKTHYGNEMELTYQYKVKVYATKEGYEDSDTATYTVDCRQGALNGDVNGDGQVGIADIVNITNIMAGKE